jgi:mRNA interferase MazF
VAPPQSRRREPPKRGEVYLADLDPTVGKEQHGKRPFLVLSIGGMNGAPAELVIGLPLTTADWSSNLHVRIGPDQSGLPRVSYAMPEMIRSVSILRFGRRMGRVPLETVETAAARSGYLTGLGKVRV